jgi:hypothetical protein
VPLLFAQKFASALTADKVGELIVFNIRVAYGFYRPMHHIE